MMSADCSQKGSEDFSETIRRGVAQEVKEEEGERTNREEINTSLSEASRDADNKRKDLINDCFLRMVLQEEENQKQERKIRSQFFGSVFGYVCWVTFAVFIALFFNLHTRPYDRFSDHVLISLLSIALANVIGIVWIIAKSLFPNKDCNGKLSLAEEIKNHLDKR